VRYLTYLGALSLLICSSPTWGQSATSTPVQRDESALSILGQSIGAMKTNQSQAISDMTAAGFCTEWNGADESAPVTYSAVRATSSHLEVHLPGSTQSWTISGSIGYSHDDKGNINRMRTANAIQARWYMPTLYLIQSFNEPGASVTLSKPGDAANENEDVVLITPPRPPGAAFLSRYQSPVPRAADCC
jgi:hypothetical protein